MRRALLAAAVVAVVAGSALVHRKTPEGKSPQAPAGPGLALGATPAPAGPDTSRAEPPLARPRSLRGTRTDGGLALEAGHFRPTSDARRLFDYFLTASGEESPEALRARIVAEIARRLPPEAAAEATAVLDRYLAYRDRVRNLAEHGDGDDLERRLATLVEIRREMLGVETADAFFADEEAQARTLLETRRIAGDPTLTPEERARRLDAAWAALDADLPPETREARATARLAGMLPRLEEELRASGAGPDAVQALRERLAGPDAAARLADLDRRRAEWTGRVEAFRAARARLADDPSLPPDERTAATERLLEESFTPAERLRVQALDRIAAAAARPTP